MKDNDIIKALERWCERNCKEICSKTKPCENCVVTIIKQALNLINRLQAQTKEKDDAIKAQADAIFLYEGSIKDKAAEIERYKGVIKLLENDVKEAQAELKEFKALYVNKVAEMGIKAFAERVKPIFEEMFELMMDDDEGKCIIKNCKKHSSVPCMNEYCIKENKEAWLTKIDNLVKEMTEQ